MKRITTWFRKGARRVADDQTKSAQINMLEELFNDWYFRRREIYKMNFIRGLFFGFGSAMGGTLLIAILLWIISLFVNFPLVGDLFQDAQDTLSQ